MDITEFCKSVACGRINQSPRGVNGACMLCNAAKLNKWIETTGGNVVFKEENPEKKDVDVVNNPEHYKHFSIEVLDVIRHTLSADKYKGYLEGNSIKYRLRAGFKNDADEDIQKALFYDKKRGVI